MYRQVTIDRFRGLQRLELGGFARINLLSGHNNIGKTALLEAIFLHACGENAPVAAVTVLGAIRNRLAFVNPQYAISGPSPWVSLFYNFNQEQPAVITAVVENRTISSSFSHVSSSPTPLYEIATTGISAETQNALSEPSAATGATGSTAGTGAVSVGNAIVGKQIYLRIAEHGLEVRNSVTTMILRRTPFGDQLTYDTNPFPGPPLMPGFFSAENLRSPHPEIAQRFSNVRGAGKDEILLEAVQQLDSRIESMEIRVEYNLPVVSLRVKHSQDLPLSLFGSGVVRLLDYLLGIYESAGGVVLIDEIENGIHHLALQGAWRAVLRMADVANVQVFATTHSQECIDAARAAFSHDQSDYRLYRMRRPNKEPKAIEVVPYDAAELAGAERMGLELR